MEREAVDEDRHLAGIAAGDADAFAAWLSCCEASVRLSLRGFATVVDTEAVLQEALLRVWQAAPRLVPDGKPNSLLRFAVRVARNTAVSELRRTRSRAGAELLPEQAESALDREALEATPEAPDPFLRAATVECLGKLPDRPKSALAARFEHAGHEPDDTLASRLGMTKNTFLQNVTRAKKALAECLQGKGISLAGLFGLVPIPGLSPAYEGPGAHEDLRERGREEGKQP